MKELRLGRRRLLYSDEGAGRTLLLLHGAAAERDEEEWDHQWPVLASAGYRVVFPLRAGRGGSDPDGPVTLARDARDAWALLDHLGLRRSGADRAQRRRRRGAADVPHPAGRGAGDGQRRQCRLRQVRLPERGPSVRSASTRLPGAPSTPGTARPWPRWGASGTIRASSTSNHLTRLMCWRRANSDRLGGGPGRPRPRRRARSRGPLVPGAPTRLRRGAGPRAPRRSRGRGPGGAAARTHESRLEVITDSGHYVQHEQPGLFNARLLDFLATLS